MTTPPPETTETKSRLISALDQAEATAEKMKHISEISVDDEDDEDDGGCTYNETVHIEEYLPLVARLLELSAIHLGPDQRAHCERWTEDDFRPTLAQAQYLERLYANCEREANLRGEVW